MTISTRGYKKPSTIRRRKSLPLARDGTTAPAVIPNPTTSSNIARQPLTTEVTQRASQLLARYIGPIATVLTRRAAQTAADEAQLYSMLAEKLADKEERERFLMEAERQR